MKNKIIKLIKEWLNQLVNEGKITKGQAGNELDGFIKKIEELDKN